MPHQLDDEARLRVLRATELLDSPLEAAFDRLTRLASSLLRAPVALVSLVDERRQFFKSAHGLAEPWASRRETPLSHSFCQHVTGTRVPLVVEDAARHPLLSSNLAIAELGVMAYLGVPLFVENQAIGALCVIDSKPRAWVAEEITLLTDLAESVVSLVKLRVAVREAHEARAVSDALLESMGDAVLAIDRRRNFVMANAAARTLFAEGTERGKPWSADWATVHRARRSDGSLLQSEDGALARGLRGEATSGLEYQVQRPDSSNLYWLEANGRPVYGQNGEVVAAVSVYRDVTARKRQADQYAALARNIPNAAVVLFDHELRCVAIDGGLLRSDGVIASALVGRTMRELASIAPLDPSFDRVEAAYRRALGGESVLLEYSHGERVLALHTGPVRDALGGISAGIVLALDVTEERAKDTEREILRSKIARQDRLVTIGTLAAGVGHEINNPLAYIAANLDFVSEELGTLPGLVPSARLSELMEVLADASAGADRIREIVRSLRAFARENGVAAAMDVRAAIEVAAQMALHEVWQRATLSLELGEVPAVLADEVRISQVVLNLLVNAAHSFPTSDPARNRVTLRTKCSAGGDVCIEISDNGPGLDPAAQARILNPFFDAKDPGPGTGLGLSICRSVVSSLGGELTVECELGKGTIFRVLLPASPGAPLPPPTSEHFAKGRRGRVLVVDDDEEVLKGFSRLLRSEHEVITVSDPRRALSLLCDPGQHFDLVLCDIVMPYLNGLELFRKVREQAAATANRFVFMTGGILDQSVGGALAQLSNECLQKPCSSQQLRALTRRFCAN
jgi:signal transduction histidine kinase